jgi:hypothetical protein
VAVHRKFPASSLYAHRRHAIVGGGKADPTPCVSW